jgi:hypothetical protein
MLTTGVVSVPCVWINVEANLAILAISLPTLRTFLRHFFPSIFDDSQAPGYSGGSGLKNYYNKRRGPGGSVSKNGRSGTFDGSTQVGTNNRSIAGRYGRMGSESKTYDDDDDTKQFGSSANEHHLDHELETRHLKSLDGVYDGNQSHHDAIAYPGRLQAARRYESTGEYNSNVRGGGPPPTGVRRHTSRANADVEFGETEIADDGSDKAIWQTKTVTVERTR